ncbi:energy transducer TonB [Granulicella sp. L60]|uniref:energy transducer TonB n=1 Tax=Granulicella sp. L60 TaxID=1641866 RepID=UPI00131BB082|nr:energy transducer TonB [Granulicella sp. L60]
MRRVIVAALALVPTLLHAQVNSPAQTQSTGSSLQSKLVQPAAFASESDRSTASSPLRISTGVNGPKLIHTVSVESDSALFLRVVPSDEKVVVALVVDESGKPFDLKVVGQVNPVLEKNVLDAVSQFRFKPGTLDDQPAPVPVELELTIRSQR